MLVLTREAGETIMVGDDIEIAYHGDHRWTITIIMDGKRIEVQYRGIVSRTNIAADGTSFIAKEGSFGITAPIEIPIIRSEAKVKVAKEEPKE